MNIFSKLDINWYGGNNINYHIHNLLQNSEKYTDPFLKNKTIATIIPHAGWRYSGFCSATSFNNIGIMKNIKRVIILGTRHLNIHGTIVPHGITFNSIINKHFEIDRKFINKFEKFIDKHNYELYFKSSGKLVIKNKKRYIEFNDITSPNGITFGNKPILGIKYKIRIISESNSFEITLNNNIYYNQRYLIPFKYNLSANTNVSIQIYVPAIIKDKLNNEYNVEHSIEINIPYILHSFPNAKIVPILVGSLNEKHLQIYSNFFNNNTNNDNTYWIISTDFLHVDGSTHNLRHNYIISNNLTQNINNITNQFLKYILVSSTNNYNNIKNSYDAIKPTICGIYALILWSKICSNWGIYGKITCAYNSLQTSDNMFKNIQHTNQSLVSYISIVFVKNDMIQFKHLMTPYERSALLNYSYSIIYNKLNSSHNLVTPLYTPTYFLNYGLFVTIKNNSRLRGCIGILTKQRSIIDNVLYFTIQAGWHDKRDNLTEQNPITFEEIKYIDIDITLLDQKLKISKYNVDNKSIIKYWNIGVDGIYIETSNKSAIFLPDVPIDFRWNKTKTLQQLSSKAGLSSNEWKKKYVNIYTIPAYKLFT